MTISEEIAREREREREKDDIAERHHICDQIKVKLIN